MNRIEKVFKSALTVVILFAFFLPVTANAQTPIFGGTKGGVCEDGNGEVWTKDAETGKIYKSSSGNPLTEAECGSVRAQVSLDDTGIASEGDVTALALKYVNFVLPFLALAAFLAFVYAGFLFVTAYGNEEQTGKAKKVMIYAVVGLILVILSYSIVNLLTDSLVESIQSQ